MAQLLKFPVCYLTCAQHLDMGTAPLLNPRHYLDMFNEKKLEDVSPKAQFGGCVCAKTFIIHTTSIVRKAQGTVSIRPCLH